MPQDTVHSDAIMNNADTNLTVTPIENDTVA